MSQQELDELDKIIEEIIIFRSLDYSSASICMREAINHFPNDISKREYIFHSLRNRIGKFTDTRGNIIESLREDILNGHREDNQ